MRFKVCIFTLTLLAASVASFAKGAPPESRWATLDGNKIHYYDIGGPKTKDAIILVHGWTCTADFWKDTYSAFPAYRVIALDLPGHGQSDKPKIQYSIEHFARAVDAVMKQTGVKKAVLVGHSMGTPIIRKHYELYPEKTLGLVIVDGALLPFGPRDQAEKFFEPLFKDYKGGAATFVDGMLQTAREDLRPFIRSSMLATPDYVGQSAMKLMLEDAYAPHGKINVPVLAVMAPAPFWPKDLEAQYRAVAPNLDFRMFEGASHFLQLERPAEFNGAVKGFIVKNKLL